MVPPAIHFNFMSAPYDREGTVAAMRKARELFSTSPLSDVVGEEIGPGPECQSDKDIVNWIKIMQKQLIIQSARKMGSDTRRGR